MSDKPKELNRLEVLRALRVSNWEAVFATAHVTLTGGAFQTGFALMLGASSFWLGIVGAVPMVCGMVQIAGSYFLQRLNRRKPVCAWFALVSRSLWLPILAAPLVLSGQTALAAFLLLFFLSNLLLHVPAPAFTSWLSDLVPPDHRGRFFGRRNMLAALTALVVSLPAGWFLDLAVKRRIFPESQAFAVLFLVAVAGGVASFLCLQRQAEPPPRPGPQPEGGLRGLAAFYATPFADGGFRRFMIFASLLAFAQWFAAPFFMVYALNRLGLEYLSIQALAALASLAGMAAMPLWGHLCDRFGNRPILAIACYGVSLLPLMWVFTDRGHPTVTLAMVLLVHVSGGFWWAGVNISQFNLLIEAAPDERKAVYLGAMSAMVGLAGGVAPVIGGAVVGMLERSTFEAFGWSFGVYQIVFAMNALMRVAAALSLGLVPGRGRATAGEVLAQIGSARIGTVVQMRRMQRAHSAEERLRATRALSGARATLAVDELIAALDDPSQMVREEAALALGEIGDERAVEPLIERLAEPETGIVDECARALGRLGDRRAVEPLLALLRDGDRLNRALAARALGRIGVREAAPDIASVLGVCDPATESEVMEACISALGALGNPAAVSVLGSLLVSEERSIRLASARAIGDIGDAASGPLLLDALRNEHEPAVLSHLAVALALVDHAGSIPDILGALNRTSSVVARRQILNAVGTLIGEHDRLYPLLGAEAFARDAAVEKLLHELAREGSVPHEQTDAILAAYLEAEHGRAAAILVASAQRSGGDRSGVLGWVARQDRAALGLDEFLLALVALRASRG